MTVKLKGTGESFRTPRQQTPSVDGEPPNGARGEWGHFLLRMLWSVILGLVLALIGALVGSDIGRYIDCPGGGGHLCGLGGGVAGLAVGGFLGFIGGLLIGIFPKWWVIALVILGWIIGVVIGVVRLVLI